MNTEEEILAAEERRLQRALSRDKSGDRPKFGAGSKIKRPDAVATSSPAPSSENLPKWKQLQLEKERQAAEAAEAERKKKEEAASAIAKRQAQLGHDVDAADDGAEGDQAHIVTGAVSGQFPHISDTTEDELARREEERLRKLIGK